MATVKQALEGLKVLDFSRVIAGPFMTQYLAQHGATVVRLESMKSPDPERYAMPYKDGKPGINRSGYFSRHNANKYSISLNLSHPRAKEVIERLVRWCDVVVENFAPGKMDKWGLSYQELERIKPDLIMLSSSNQGQTGPSAHVAGYGFTLTSLSGFTALTGWSDREPCQPFGGLTDFIAPCLGAIILLAALEYRRRTGKGQYLDISQYECSVFTLSPVLLDYIVNEHEWGRTGNRCQYAAPHGAYPCQEEDRWCVIAVASEEEWTAFCNVIGKPELAGDPRFSCLERRKKNEDELDAIVSQWTRARTPEEVTTMLQQAGVAAGIVQSPPDLLEDPQLRHRNHFQAIEHPELGYYNHEMPAFRLSDTPAKLSMPAPCLGQHNEYIYKEVLGMPEEQFVQLLMEGVLE